MEEDPKKGLLFAVIAFALMAYVAFGLGPLVKNTFHPVVVDEPPRQVSRGLDIVSVDIQGDMVQATIAYNPYIQDSAGGTYAGFLNDYAYLVRDDSKTAYVISDVSYLRVDRLNHRDGSLYPGEAASVDFDLPEGVVGKYLLVFEPRGFENIEVSVDIPSDRGGFRRLVP